MLYREASEMLQRVATMPTYLLPNEMNSPKGIIRMLLSDLFGEEYDDDNFVKSLKIDNPHMVDETHIGDYRFFVVDKPVDGHVKSLVVRIGASLTHIILMDNYLYDETTRERDKIIILKKLVDLLLVSFKGDNVPSKESTVWEPVNVIDNWASDTITIWLWHNINDNILDDTESRLMELASADDPDFPINNMRIECICTAIRAALDHSWNVIQMLLDNSLLYGVIKSFENNDQEDTENGPGVQTNET